MIAAQERLARSMNIRNKYPDLDIKVTYTLLADVLAYASSSGSAKTLYV